MCKIISSLVGIDRFGSLLAVCKEFHSTESESENLISYSLPPMIVCVMSDQTVQRPPVIAAGVMMSVCDTLHYRAGDWVKWWGEI